MIDVIIYVLLLCVLLVYLIFGFTILLDCKRIVNKLKENDFSIKEFIDFIRE